MYSFIIHVFLHRHISEPLWWKKGNNSDHKLTLTKCIIILSPSFFSLLSFSFLPSSFIQNIPILGAVLGIEIQIQTYKILVLIKLTF